MSRYVDMLEAQQHHLVKSLQNIYNKYTVVTRASLSDSEQELPSTQDMLNILESFVDGTDSANVGPTHPVELYEPKPDSQAACQIGTTRNTEGSDPASARSSPEIEMPMNAPAENVTNQFSFEWALASPAQQEIFPGLAHIVHSHDQNSNAYASDSLFTLPSMVDGKGLWEMASEPFDFGSEDMDYMTSLA